MSKTTKSAEIAKGGIQTASRFIDLMSALMSDLLNEEVTPEVGKVVCQAAKNMLDVVRMSQSNGSDDFINKLLPAKTSPGQSASSDVAGKVKCNQCEERVSPRDLTEHKKSMHPLPAIAR